MTEISHAPGGAEHSYEEPEHLEFGKSRFRGRDSLGADLERAWAQLLALLKKNWFILSRRVFPLLIVIFLPAAALMIMFLGNDGVSSSASSTQNYPSFPLQGLGPADVDHGGAAVQVVFAPDTARFNGIMSDVAVLNDLDFGTDVVGFPSNYTAKRYVAEHLGTVQFTVFFVDDRMWELNSESGSVVESPAQTSYVIFSNNSANDEDSRSYKTGVNFPLLALQKSIDHSIMRSVASDPNAVVYEADYGTLWSFRPDSDIPLSGLLNSTDCDLEQRNFDDLATAATWVFPFMQAMIGVIAFQLVTEERSKYLFSMLRRLGLYDSVYWLSWSVSFLVLNILGAVVAVIFAAIVSSAAYPLRHIDYGVIFTLFLVANTSSVSMSMFLASVSNTSSANTAVVIVVFITLVFTIAFCSTPLNEYQYDIYFDGDAGRYVRACTLETSSYNTIYSSNLLGSGFVEFLVFFMPWFHMAQAITDILSVVQYDGETFHFSDLREARQKLSYSGTVGSEFDSKWVEWSYGMMLASALVYLFLAWLLGLTVSSDVSEGRELTTIFFPPRLRQLLWYWLGDTGLIANPRPVIQEGDVRGHEKEASLNERSIRGYKVSKTFSSVQALKEISFTMKTGEVFVILGHNGAGKSTLINIITGQYACTHGSVFVSGMDVAEDVSLIQQSIGVCPQADLLWDDLSAREHIDIHAAFKGIESGDVLNKAVGLILKKVGLLERGDTYAKDFSGGMKRRLAVAMSAVGEVDAIFLDEPTTGLDPLSRHGVWDVINWLKGNKVVVLTTHNMEEADFLGDNILIMHEGKKKAFGNSLFLKETYGRGYQINLVTEKSYVPNVEMVLKSSLPGSHFIGDSQLTGYISVNVSRRDVYNLPRFFAWLESSPGALANIREWGISNTTLEQVFLLLSQSSTGVNFVDNREAEDSTLCPMCRLRPKETVMVRNIPGQIFLLPEAVCAVCTATNKNYFVSESDFSSLQQIAYPSDLFTEEINRLLGSARDKATLEYLDGMHFCSASRPPEGTTNLSIEPPEGTTALSIEPAGVSVCDGGIGTERPSVAVVELAAEDSQPSDSTSPAPPVLTPTEPVQATSDATAPSSVAPNPHELVISTVKSQIEAVLIKNARLQSLQRCSNACGVLFVGVMFLFLYVFSLLFQDADSISQCRGGYVTFGGDGCNSEYLINHIFAGRDNDEFIPTEDSPDNKPLGFAVQAYLLPSYSVDTITADTTAEFLYYENHFPILWSDLSADQGNYYYNSLYVRSLPNFTSDGSSTKQQSSNDVMYSNQQTTYDASISMQYPRCPAFAPLPEIYGGNGVYAPTEQSSFGGFTEEFSNHYASASFDCQMCGVAVSAPLLPFFNGTLWVADVDTTDSSLYLYSFLSFNGSKLDDDGFEYDYYPTTVCPADLGSITNSPEFNQLSNTRNSMTYLNLLSNTIYNASVVGQTLPIQTGTSEYGNLFFDAAAVARVVSLFLSIFAILLMNGTWPLAVWRLSYEKSARIALMMKTVGMRPYAYIFGMYVFDMIISCTFGIGAMIGAVELNLSRFENAPLGYLVLTSVLSAHALNGLAILSVQFYAKRSTLLSLLAAVFSIACTIGSLLLIVIKYPNDGDWPNALSIIPFFAQARTIYILLVYNTKTDEVDIALALLFAVGTVCIMIALLVEYKIDIPFFVEHLGLFSSTRRKNVTTVDNGPNSGGGDVEMGDMSRDALPDADDSRSSHQHASNKSESICCICQRSDYAVIPARRRMEDDSDYISDALVDIDVLREKEQVAELTKGPGDASTHPSDVGPPAEIFNPKVAIVISQVSYTFPSSLNGTPGTKALRNISLRIEYGECFGLLGPNGSGKTTLISALSGYRTPRDGGAIYIAGKNITHDADIIHSMVGVCPQEDIVWNELNVHQHLSFQAKQRGIPDGKINAEVQRVAVLVNLDGDALLTPAAKLSGGMKRRLSIGMSITGDPPILYLDECTAGLDPENKHQIWKIVQKLKNPNRCILFTSHSMDEVETLSSRIGIMVKGRLQCVGSSMHLKKKYGDGYSITVNILKTKSPTGASMSVGEDVENEARMLPPQAADSYVVAEDNEHVLDDFVVHSVANGKGTLIAVVNNTRKYRIDKDTRSISDIFMLMESNKVKYHIREWGISMATLEEVFISAVERATENEKK